MNHVLVCVNYNTYDSLKKYLDSIEISYAKVKEKSTLLVLVADNSTEIKAIENNYCYELKVVESQDNLGYFGGISYAVEKSGINLSDADFVYFSNVDLMMENDFFETLESMEVPQSVGCIAPAILSETEGKNRNPKIINRPSLKRMKLLLLMYKIPIIYYLYSKLLYSKRKEKNQDFEDGFIYAPHGSFMIYTSLFADFLQSMKYPPFLFGEEIFIAENLIKAELKTYYCSGLKIKDSDHVSTGKLKSKMFFKYNGEAMSYLIKEYFL